MFSQFANSKLKAGDVLEEHLKGSLRSLPDIDRQKKNLYLEAESPCSFYSKVGFEKRT
jgi:hypothetical protein